MKTTNLKKVLKIAIFDMKRECTNAILKNKCFYCITFADVSLIVIPFCLSVCLDVCRSFRDLQPTTIDRSQPNLVGKYIPVLGPV